MSEREPVAGDRPGGVVGRPPTTGTTDGTTDGAAGQVVPTAGVAAEGPEVPMVSLGRFVVALVVAAVVLLAALVGAVAAYTASPEDLDESISVTILGVDVLLLPDRPSREMLLAALLAMVAVAAGALLLEAAAALRLLRSPDRQVLQAVIQRPLRAPTGHPVRITVLVPAHNEEAMLPVTLGALSRQSRPPDRVVVVADNCTDGTVEAARAAGAEVFETVGNRHRKGGALNQALAQLLPGLGPDDAVMVMDADTVIGPEYLATATRRLDEDPALEAVGGVFFGEPGHGLLGLLQRNEYLRYSKEIARRSGRVFVLTGTASVFRAESLRAVAASRGVCLPGAPGQVYDTASLTEDNELTLALKSLGAPMTSPAGCAVETELMPTWRDLWRQRLRWERGALENVAAYGFTTATARYWAQQVAIAYGAVALNTYFLLLAITLLAADQVALFVFWALVGLVFVVERVVTVWGNGWRARLLAALVFPELFYDLFQQVVFGKGLLEILVSRRATWHHVDRSAEGVRA